MKRREKLEKEAKRLVKILSKEYRPQKIILFGSLVRGRVHEWSDLDIVIVKETRKRIYDRIGEVLRICRPQISVDFIIYTPAEFEQMVRDEPFVRDEIVKNGRVLYEKAA